jgi:hypothetical protein
VQVIKQVSYRSDGTKLKSELCTKQYIEVPRNNKTIPANPSDYVRIVYDHIVKDIRNSTLFRFRQPKAIYRKSSNSRHCHSDTTEKSLLPERVELVRLRSKVLRPPNW